MPYTPLPKTSGKKITLYGARSAPSTTVVLAWLREIRLDYSFFQIEDEKGFLEKQPFAKLPVVQDGNRLLFGARNIIRHYAEEMKGKQRFLLDESNKPNEEVDKWLSFENENFYPHADELLGQLVSAKLLELPPDEEVIKRKVEKLGEVLDEYQKRLEKNDYLAGKFYSHADLVHLPFIHYIVNETDKGSLITKRPSVNKWWEAISNRDNWRKALKEKSLLTDDKLKVKSLLTDDKLKVKSLKLKA